MNPHGLLEGTYQTGTCHTWTSWEQEVLMSRWPKKCPTRLSHKSVPLRVSQNVSKESCPTRVSHKSVSQSCTASVSTRVSYRSVPQECTRLRLQQESPTRGPQERRQDCATSVSYKSRAVAAAWDFTRIGHVSIHRRTLPKASPSDRNVCFWACRRQHSSHQTPPPANTGPTPKPPDQQEPFATPSRRTQLGASSADAFLASVARSRPGGCPDQSPQPPKQ